MSSVVGILNTSKQFGVESGTTVINWATEKAGINIIWAINPLAMIIGFLEKVSQTRMVNNTQRYVQMSTISRNAIVDGMGIL